MERDVYADASMTAEVTLTMFKKNKKQQQHKKKTHNLWILYEIQRI